MWNEKKGRDMEWKIISGFYGTNNAHSVKIFLFRQISFQIYNQGLVCVLESWITLLSSPVVLIPWLFYISSTFVDSKVLMKTNNLTRRSFEIIPILLSLFLASWKIAFHRTIANLLRTKLFIVGALLLFVVFLSLSILTLQGEINGLPQQLLLFNLCWFYIA